MILHTPVATAIATALMVLLLAALGLWALSERQHTKEVRELHAEKEKWRTAHLKAMREFTRISVGAEAVVADCRRKLRAAGIDTSAYEREMGEMYAYRMKVKTEFELHNLEG